MQSCCRVIIITCTAMDAKRLLPSQHFDSYIPDWRGSYRSGLHRTRSINSPSMFTACTTQRNCIRRVIRRQPTLSHVTSDQCTHSYWKYTNRYLRCIHMMTRQQLYILIKPDQTWSNLIKPRRITTPHQNSVSTPPISEVIPLYWRHLTWRGLHVTSAKCVSTFRRNV
jgi:hypothetical protein